MSDNAPETFELILGFPNSDRKIRAGREVTFGTLGGAYVVDGDGVEHHFGGLTLRVHGSERYAYAEYVGSYREPGSGVEFDYSLSSETISGSVELEAASGPKLSDAVLKSLASMASSCNQGNGVAQQTEKEIIVWYAQALRRGGFPLPRDEVKIWSATHGWRIDQAEDIAALMERAYEGKSFRPKIQLSDEMFGRIQQLWNGTEEAAA